MSDTEKQILGIGPSANAQLKAQVDEQLAQMKADEQKAVLDLKSKDFEENLQNNITTRTQRQQQFGQNQTRLQQLAQQNFILKTKSLQQQMTNAKTATDRAAIAQQIADTGRSQMKMNAFKDQLASIDRQETTLTAQERAVMTANKTQPGGLGGIFEKDTGVTDAGQAQISTIQAQLKTLDSQRADVLKQQYAYVDSLNKSLNSMTSGTTSTATPVAKPAATKAATTTASSAANPFR
jgi:myosin heavy subunit